MNITPIELGQIMAGYTHAERMRAPSSADPAVYLLHQILKGQAIMSDKFATLDAKLDELTAATANLSGRVDAQNTKLSAAEAARDAAVSDLATTKATLADVQAQLAAMPNDTAALEAQIQAETDKVSGVIAALNGIDATPVVLAPVTDPAPEPAADAPPAETTAEPAPVTTAPAETDGPVGVETPLPTE